MERTKTRLPMNLQFFAAAPTVEGEGGVITEGAGAEESVVKESTTPEQPEPEAVIPLAEVSNMIKEALKEAREFENMTPEEQNNHQMDQREQELVRRELDLEAKEMKAAFASELIKDKLPPGLAEILPYSNKEEYEKGKGILTTSFQAAVQQAVNERLRGNRPPLQGQPLPEGAKHSDSDFIEMLKAEQAKR